VLGLNFALGRADEPATPGAQGLAVQDRWPWGVAGEADRVGEAFGTDDERQFTHYFLPRLQVSARHRVPAHLLVF
jgi:hypothetical protein